MKNNYEEMIKQESRYGSIIIHLRPFLRENASNVRPSKNFLEVFYKDNASIE